MQLLRDEDYGGRLSSNGNVADFDDAMEMIHTLWNKVHAECSFSEIEPLGTNPESINLPAVVYNLVHRKHSEHFSTGGKPKQINIFPDPEQEGCNIIQASEWFDCTVDFTVYASTKKDVKDWMKNLENFLLAYTGYFRDSGIQEILFQEEGPISVSTEYRQDLPHRRLRYLVRIQRIQNIRTIKLDDVDVKVTMPNRNNTGKVEIYPESEFMNLYKKNYKQVNKEES